MRILIADDHEVIRRGVARVLQSRGDVEEYAEATNGEEAVEKALEWKPDLILLDIQMPLLDGFAEWPGKSNSRSRVFLSSFFQFTTRTKYWKKPGR